MVKSDDAEARLRSLGPLTQAERAQLKTAGARLAFDPVQIGPVPNDVLDDIAPRAEGPKAGWPSISAAAERLTLRAWNPSDSDRFAALLDDPEIWAFMPTTKPEQLDQAVAETLIMLSNDAAHHVVRAICLQGQPIGQVRLERHSPDRVELSYWLGRAYWGGGLATRALAHFLALEVSAQEQVFARVHRDNAASARVLTKIGLTEKTADPANPTWNVYARDAH